MLVIKQLSNLPENGRPVVLAMGCFDGVHIGHQKVIVTAVEQARACGGDAWIYTFDPHPAKILVPDKAPPLISAPVCRLRQFAALGVAGVIEIPFDTSFAHMEPGRFLSNLWNDLPRLKGIVCGIDWSFGYKASGMFQTLEAFCKKTGLSATAVHPVLFHGGRVSSTLVRKALHEGNIPFAEQLLGRPFCLYGTVVKGRGVGRRLGFPTANILPDNELIPASGVYAAWTRIQAAGGEKQGAGIRVQGSGCRDQEADLRPLPGVFPSAVFIGKRATFDDHEPAIEAYLLDFSGDLYNQPIEIELVAKTRDVTPFPSEQALITQIGLDIAHIRALLNSSAKPSGELS